MIRINLLPAREAKRRIELRNQLQVGCLLLVLAIAGGIWLTYTQSQTKATRLATLERLEAEIVSLESLVNEVNAFQRRSDQLRKQVEVITALRTKQSRPAPVLDALSESLPDQLWLVKVQEAGNRLQITGNSLNGMVGIAAFMDNLGRSPWFGNAELIESKSEILLERTVVSFTLTVPMKTPKQAHATSQG
jgi:type IV pilus assembly protein PilN